MKRLIIVSLISVVVIPLMLSLLFVRKYTRYELKNDNRINSEIMTVTCFLGQDDDELSVEIVECDWYGQDLCVNGQKVVDQTLQVIPFLTENADTLEFIKETEGSLIYRCPNHKNDCWTDELKVSLSYKFDSLGSTYGKQFSLNFVKNARLRFSVH